MDDHDPNEPEDTADLEAALEALKAHHPSPEEVDPETAALVQRADFQEGIEIRRRLAQMEPPAAPAAVEIAAGGGAVLVQAEAVSTYVAPVEVTLPEAPRLPSAPVKILDEVDPRRKPTVRIARKAGTAARVGVGTEEAGAAASGSATASGSAAARALGEAADASENEAGARSPWAKEGDEKAAALDRAMLPSATAPAAAHRAVRAGMTRASAARPNAVTAIEAPSSGAEPVRRRGLAVGGAVGVAIVFVAGAISMRVGMRGPERSSGEAVGLTATATVTTGIASAAPSAVASGAGRVEAAVASMDGTATPAAPSTGVTSVTSARAAAGATSGAVEPRSSADPYADASAPVVTSAPSVVASAPPSSVASAVPPSTTNIPLKPAVTTTVAAPPPAASTSRPLAPYVPEKD